MRQDEEPIIVEQTFDASIDAVWNALTEADQMRQWFFDKIPSFEPEVGFETQFNIQIEERNFRHLWKVTEVVPLQKIKYNWKYEDHPGDSYVVFELFEQDSHTTKLRLTHEVHEDFPDDIPEFERESGVQGWTYFIEQSLKEFLAKNH